MRFLHLLVATWLTAVVLAYPIDRISGSGLIREAIELDGASFALRFDSGDVQSLEARQPGAKDAAKRIMYKISRTVKRPFHPIMNRIRPHEPVQPVHSGFNPNKFSKGPDPHLPLSTVELFNLKNPKVKSPGAVGISPGSPAGPRIMKPKSDKAAPGKRQP